MIDRYAPSSATLAVPSGRRVSRLTAAGLCVVALCGLSACGGTDSPGPPPGASVSGTVVAGSHIQNAVVFLDLNDNNVLDSNERRTTTDANGHFTLTGLFADDISKHAIVARVFPIATNTDTGLPAGLDCTLKVAAGGGTLISPYSTMVASLASGGTSAPTVGTATAQVVAKLRASTLPLILPGQLDLSRDYVTDSGASTATSGDSRQLRLLATSLAGILSAVTAGLNQRQSVFDANSGFPFDTLVTLTEAQLTQVANGTVAFGQLDAVQQANLVTDPGSRPNFFIDGNAMLNAFISSINLSDLLPDIKNFIVNSDEFKSFFASVMLDLASEVAELLIEIVF